MKIFIMAVLISSALLACNIHPSQHFQIVSSNGNAYRLNEVTGEVIFIHGNVSERVDIKTGKTGTVGRFTYEVVE